MVEIQTSGFPDVGDDFTAFQMCIVILINEKGLELRRRGFCGHKVVFLILKRTLHEKRKISGLLVKGN
jgi:hypothetical protein